MNNSSLQRSTPKGWDVKKIKDLLDYERPDKYIVQNASYDPKGKTPVLTANKSFVLGYTSETEGIYTDTPAIIFDDFTTDSKFVDFPFKVKSSAIKILKNKKKVDLRFIFEKMKSIIFPIANHKRHYISQYQDMEMIVPPFSEQQKIAEILSSVDEEIKKVEEIISATEKMKGALMQKLFVRGEKYNLNDLCIRIIGGGTPSRGVQEYWGGDIPWVTVKDLTNKKFISDAQEKITDIGLENSASNIIPKGNIITSTRMGIGRFYINDADVAINQDLKGLILRDGVVVDFLYYFLISRASVLESKGVGSTVKGIKVDELKNLPVLVPSLDDQKRIAATFSSIDEKITVNRKVKEKLFQLKKGLMNDLLTGKVRTI